MPAACQTVSCLVEEVQLPAPLWSPALIALVQLDPQIHAEQAEVNRQPVRVGVAAVQAVSRCVRDHERQLARQMPGSDGAGDRWRPCRAGLSRTPETQPP